MKRATSRALATGICFTIATTVMAAEPGTARISKADDYPSRPLRVIDPFAAAGASDIMVRLVAQKFTERFGASVIIDNRPGAGGNLAAEIAAKATPDGYTLLNIVMYSMAPSVALYPNLPFKPMRDFAFITTYGSGAYVIVALPSFAAKTIPELITLAKSQPGKIGYGSSGVGGPVHLAGELLKSRAGINLLHVPYKGAAPIMTAVAGGEVQLGLPSVAGALPMLKAGRVIPIAVTGAQRAKALPNVPTIAESGFPGYDITPWYGVAAPAGTPSAILKGLHAELARIIQSPEIQSAYAAQGLDAAAIPPDRFRALMQDAIAISQKIVKDVGIKPE